MRKSRRRRHVAGDVDVGPAVVVEIGGNDTEAVAAAGLQDAGFLADIGEGAVAIVVIKSIVGQAVVRAGRTSRQALPLAGVVAAGLGGMGQIEIDVVGDEDIELAVTIVVEQRAAGTPARAGDRKMRREQ